MSQIEEVVHDTCEESEVLPVLPLRGLVAFPEMLIHFDVGRLISMKALEQSMQDNQRLFLTAQRDIRTDAPTTDDLFVVGTVCTVKQILRLPILRETKLVIVEIPFCVLKMGRSV